MQKKILFIVFLLISTLNYGQIGGKSVYQFLNISAPPRQAALGAKTVSLYDEDVNQAHFNPATINSKMDNNFALNYGNYFGEVTYGTASYAFTTLKNQNTYHLGVNYINYGTFEGRDENGLLTSNFTGSEIALSAGYAYTIPKTNLHLGANAKFISSTFESYNSIGIGVDFGALYIDSVENINFGLVIKNLGTQLTTYSGDKEKFPTEIIAGFSKQLKNVPISWHLTLENLQQWNVAFSNPARTVNSIDGSVKTEKVSVINNALRHVIIGAELFPKRSFNLRLGYNFRRAEELRLLEQKNFSGLSLGFGLRFNNIKFNYSYSKYTLAANTSLLGLNIHFK